jgi:hypothetical protein
MIKEDIVTTTAGIEGPKLPIKTKTVTKDVLRRATQLKKKNLIEKELGISVDLLFCDETNESMFLDNMTND